MAAPGLLLGILLLCECICVCFYVCTIICAKDRFSVCICSACFPVLAILH
jgi:hypothetical protein